MAVYYYLSGNGSHATQQAVMAYTHDDVYKPVAGFKTVTGHFHLELNEMVRDRGTSDLSPTWLPVFRGLGINIVYLGDFHDDSDGTDPGPKRLPEQKAYFDASAKLSDKDFLVMPEEEANDVYKRQDSGQLRGIVTGVPRIARPSNDVPFRSKGYKG